MDDYVVSDRSWYKRALSNTDLIMSSPAYSDAFITNQHVVSFSKAVQLNDNEHTVIGVAGIDVRYNDIDSIINNITSGGCSAEDVECYIVDKYGYLFYDSISNNQSSLFLGTFKGTLVKSLLNNGLMSRKTKLTPFVECAAESQSANSNNNDDGDGGDGNCVGLETYYEISSDIPSTGKTLDLFDTCMQGEYTIVQVSQTNLYMIVFRGRSGYCSESNAIVPTFEQNDNYWCESYTNSYERYSDVCASTMERECTTTCPGESEDDALMYCGGSGDCINGMCVCDSGFEGGDNGSCITVSDAYRGYDSPFIMVLFTLFIVVVSMLTEN